MTRSILAGLVLLSGLLVAGCVSDPTCDDVDSLQSQLDGMDIDDPDFNTVNGDLKLAQADCNG